MSHSAASLVRVFHDRDPSWRRQVRVALPRFLRERGEMISVGYASDKHEEPGDQYEYVHEHDPGVTLYEACDRGDPGAVAAPDWPAQFACLGSLWHLSFHDLAAGKDIEASIPRGMWLLSTPSGRRLLCVHPERGFFGALWGGRMFVGPDGIEH